MRPVWKGHISFGLVQVPVSLYPAEQRGDLNLHLIDSRDFARVRYERVNADTGEEVPWDKIVKGYEYDSGNYVVVGKDELKKVAPEANQTVEIERFVDLADIDFTYFDKPYYLEPGKKGEKGYALLRDALRETGKAGIARVVIRTRQYMAALVPRGNGMVVEILRYHQELRSMEDLDLPGDASEVGVSEQEMKMARTLVESMAGDWDPAEYHDEARERLQTWLDEQIKSGKVERAPEADTPPEREDGPINIMDALKRSVGAAKDTKKTTKKKSKSGKKAG